jgi:hypothetical protein
MFVLLLLATTLNGIVALVQYQLTPDELAKWGPGYEKLYSTGTVVSRRVGVSSTGEIQVRPSGLGSDVGSGGVLGIVSAPAILALFAIRRGRKARIAAGLLGVGVVLALLTSQTRLSVILGAIAALAFVALSTFSRQRLRVLAGVSLTLVLVWAGVSFLSSQAGVGVFDRYKSIAPSRVLETAIDYKTPTFHATGDYLTRFPVGAGLGSVGPAAVFAGGPSRENVDGESEFNFLLVELGLPGLLFMVGFVLWLLVLAFTRIPRVRDDDVRPLLAALGAIVVAIFVGFAGGATTISPPTGPLLWLTAGVFAYWLVHLPAERRRELWRQPARNP